MVPNVCHNGHMEQSQVGLHRGDAGYDANFPPHADPEGLKRLVLRVHPTAWATLQEMADRLAGGNKAELIRRAVSVYRLIENAREKDSTTEVLLRRGEKTSEIVCPFW
jgi:hypothetical protein